VIVTPWCVEVCGRRSAFGAVGVDVMRRRL
jgi:hypothetical protein